MLLETAFELFFAVLMLGGESGNRALHFALEVVDLRSLSSNHELLRLALLRALALFLELCHPPCRLFLQLVALALCVLSAHLCSWQLELHLPFSFADIL